MRIRTLDPVREYEMLKAKEHLFWAKVDQQGHHWLWKGQTGKRERGIFNFSSGRKQYTVSAHRGAWLLTKGPIMDVSLYVVRKCKEHCCIHPNHMFLGISSKIITWKSPMTSKEREENFWRRVDKISSPNGCWLWTGALGNDGYGRLEADNGRHAVAHRYAWIKLKGRVPRALHVCHNCPGGDNPACVNPDHMFLGTDKDNMQDALKKGKHFVPGLKGEQHGMAKLTSLQVRIIRYLFRHGLTCKAQLGRMCGISPQQINLIIERRSWKHI